MRGANVKAVTGEPAYGLRNIKRRLANNTVPIIFAIFCLLGVYYAQVHPLFLINSVITRMARNSFLVLSLIIPVMAGMGLNFGIVMGAMAGQMALIAITHWQIEGLGGFVIAALLSLPLAVLFGWLTGIVLNKAKGNEMITGMILGFFANGLYQLFFLFVLGGIIPMKNERLMLSSGIGIRNTVDLKAVKYALNDIIKLKLGGLVIPLFTFFIIALLCVMLHFLTKTKLGQDFRSVGQNMHIAEISGINVDRTRIIAIIISTVLAAWGQLIFLQDIGTLNTYGSHEQVGLFAVASILIGGASVTKATIGQTLLGTFLFHTLFIISPMAGQNLLGSPQVGEYFRVFVAYGVIGVSLGLHAWQKQKQAMERLKAEQ
ncbi:MAG: ABC transporter permease [Firmicutes bacterium]|jgi:simple sugar transport system permease protein|nr:ABC transporter permease [Bacillota bacterium]